MFLIPNWQCTINEIIFDLKIIALKKRQIYYILAPFSRYINSQPFVPSKSSIFFVSDKNSSLVKYLLSVHWRNNPLALYKVITIGGNPSTLSWLAEILRLRKELHGSEGGGVNRYLHFSLFFASIDILSSILLY